MNWNKWLEDNQGERMDALKPINPIDRRRVHIARYVQARRWINDLSDIDLIIDWPSGTGYGSFILSKTGLFVKGYEVDKMAVEYAEIHYGQKCDRLTFNKANMLHTEYPAIPNPRAVVVSLEGIEHVTDPGTVIKNFSMTAPRLIISFPHNWGLGVYHKFNTTYENMQSMLHKAGYDILNAVAQGKDAKFCDVSEMFRLDKPCVMFYCEFDSSNFTER